VTILEAIILGLVEGLTEYLPISSTGHLILAEALLGIDADEDTVNAFLIVIQGGAIAAVAGLYWSTIVAMLRGAAGRDPAGLRLLINVAVAFAPAAVLGPLLADWIEAHLFRPWAVLAALAAGGVVMIALPTKDRGTADLHDLDWRRALVIGLLQCLAMWPGTSRSMVTIVGGALVGLHPRAAAQFSFILGLPTLGGACAYSLWQEPGLVGTLGPAPILAGFLVAAVSAALAVRWMVGYLTRHGLSIFGWYRLALCAAMALLAARGVIEIAP
jgi:undecaprenyl-diphosphatase